MRIAITGASGLVGSALASQLAADGVQVHRLVRKTSRLGQNDIAWDPEFGTIDIARLEGVDAFVHLAGESIATRWNDDTKRRIRESRVRGTTLVAESLSRLAVRPSVFVCASAIGIYGPRGDEPLDETAAPGTDFLADVCQAWEAATEPARQAGVRVVNLRFGVVLAKHGGALAKMLTPFKLGLGGPFGSGKQFMSWLALPDAVGAIRHALSVKALAGPANAVAPNPVTNAEFTKTLGRVISRPTIFPMPAFAARLAFGEMADSLLLAGQRVVPARLAATGYVFRQPHLEQALYQALAATDGGR